MSDVDLFNAGNSSDPFPEADAARQAIDSLRGYAYQVLAAALAWFDIDENGRLFLEVAEDYTVVVKDALSAVQVKDTLGSGSVTLNSPNVRAAIAAFVDLVDRNPGTQVELRFLTTSDVGTEHAVVDRPEGMAGLKYWQKVAAGANPAPLRAILTGNNYPESVRNFCESRDDDEFVGDLIKKIHWDCGKPPFLTLRQELEARLVVVGRDRFQLPSFEARRLADTLVYEVLKTSIAKNPRDRVLTRAGLYQVIDVATRVSVPRESLDAITRFAANVFTLLNAGLDPGGSLSVAETGWIVDGGTLPIQRGVIARDVVECGVADALRNSGVAVLVGGSGLGKTTVSRAVALTRADAFSVVDFRNIDADETRRRLDMLFGRIGGLSYSMLILEDLNHLDNPQVYLSLARVVECLRRRDRRALITCYRTPSVTALEGVGLEQACVVDCPYLSEEEADALVSVNGGNPNRWGRLAYLAGASGHPQLTHAFVRGIAARGWPVEEIHQIVSHGLSSADTDVARHSVRRSLVSVLSEQTRNLLYRLSLTIGQFDHSVALAVGEISPDVKQAGERLDELVGPWIEALGRGRFRVSPLARGFGSETLPLNEQKRVHEAIAVQTVRRDSITPTDMGMILVHGVAGKSRQSLVTLAHCVLSASPRTLELITEHLSIFSILRTDAPIFPDDLVVSSMLRMGQFKLVAAASDGSKISSVVAALFNEIDRIDQGQIRGVVEALSLFTLLSTIGVANYVDDWLGFLTRLKVMVEADRDLQRIVADMEHALDANDRSFFGALFCVGSANLGSVARLEHVIDEVDKLDANDRELWLKPIAKEFSDYSVFINGPWVTQRHSEAFDAADAALRYGRMAEKTRGWGIRALSMQCSVAQAIMLDEYQTDRESALAVLEEAIAYHGSDVILSRALAKVYFRHDEHGKALSILRGVANELGSDDAVERAFALREAAISAVKCGELLQAEKWFLEASSAAEAARLDDMNAMAIGLRADSAVVAFEAGGVGRALARLVDAVNALSGLDPEKTLRAAYCHRVIRHTVLWLKSRVEGSDVKIGGEPICMDAGICSNPDPSPAIREQTLSHIDTTWYVLAESEAAAGVDLAIASSLGDRLEEGRIPLMEFGVRCRVMQTCVDGLDAAGFAAHFITYVETVVHVFKNATRLKDEFDPLAPERGQVPTLVGNGLLDPVVEQVARDALLAYAIQSVFTGQVKTVTRLETALVSRYKGAFPGKAVFDQWNETSVSLSASDQRVLTVIKELLRAEHMEPEGLCAGGLTLLGRIAQSPVKRLLMMRLAAWQRSNWMRILETERYRLARPSYTAPRIEEVLRNPKNDRSFVAKLFLATSEAVGLSLGPYRATLNAMAEEV